MLDKPVTCYPEAGCGDENRLDGKTWDCFSSEEVYNLLHHGLMHSPKWWPPALPLQRSGCLWACSLEKGQWACKRVKEWIFICLTAIAPAICISSLEGSTPLYFERAVISKPFFPYFLLSWWFCRCGTFFFPLENLFHINMFISVNLFNWRASPLQLVSSASINHSLAQYSLRLILNNSVYKICFKTHLSLGIYVHIRNTQ